MPEAKKTRSPNRPADQVVLDHLKRMDPDSLVALGAKFAAEKPRSASLLAEGLNTGRPV